RKEEEGRSQKKEGARRSIFTNMRCSQFMIEGSAIALLVIIRASGKKGFSGREGRARDLCTKAKIEAVLKSTVKTKNLGGSSAGMMI
ncbi:hypothetical protein QUA00_31515, partial [Microcoleus sp. T2B6]